jgi:hypothetical protein
MATGVRGELEQAYKAPAATKSELLLQLHRDGVPFVQPSRRGIDPSAPGFDPEDFLDLLAEDVMCIQHAKLREILEVQADVEYLRRHGLDGRTDVESFRKCVPVVSYGDLEGDVTRLVNGDQSPILTVDPIIAFNMRFPFSPFPCPLPNLSTVGLHIQARMSILEILGTYCGTTLLVGRTCPLEPIVSS